MNNRGDVKAELDSCDVELELNGDRSDSVIKVGRLLHKGCLASESSNASISEMDEKTFSAVDILEQGTAEVVGARMTPRGAETPSGRLISINESPTFKRLMSPVLLRSPVNRLREAVDLPDMTQPDPFVSTFMFWSRTPDVAGSVNSDDVSDDVSPVVLS